MRHLTAILSSFTLLLTFVFYFRWSRGISTTPILLQSIRHSFSFHPELLDFGEDTQKRWRSQTDHEWWRTEWTDEDGRRVLMGIDMLHKIHCLVSIREEFSALLLNGTYHYDFYDRNQIDKRLHLGHCFDLIRQDILCYSDITLEPLGENYSETDGFGVEHTCKDWTQLLRLRYGNDEF